MNRFYVEPAHISETTIKIVDPGDVRHLIKALRVQKGEDFLISDGQGCRYLAGVDFTSGKEVSLKIKERLTRVNREEQKIKVCVACAVSQNTRFEEVIDKGTQLGVDEIIPLFTERTLVKKAVFDKKRARLGRVLVAAAKQSGVLFLPHLKDSISFDNLIDGLGKYDLCLLPNLSENVRILKDAIMPFKKGRILVLIGPEGDFSPQEIGKAIRAGCQGVTLGDSVLRVDTAAIAMISYLKLNFGL